jgi:integrase
MLYYGGLTFDSKDPAHYLNIPNAVAAVRIAEAVLKKHGLRHSLTAALHSLISNGDILPVLSCYRDLMVQRDVGHSDYESSEQIHRDSFYYSLLQNASLRPQVEFKPTKVRHAAYK